jgi:hypothetical protein
MIGVFNSRPSAWLYVQGVDLISGEIGTVLPIFVRHRYLYDALSEQKVAESSKNYGNCRGGSWRRAQQRCARRKALPYSWLRVGVSPNFRALLKRFGHFWSKKLQKYTRY